MCLVQKSICVSRNICISRYVDAKYLPQRFILIFQCASRIGHSLHTYCSRTKTDKSLKQSSNKFAANCLGVCRSRTLREPHYLCTLLSQFSVVTTSSRSANDYGADDSTLKFLINVLEILICRLVPRF